MNLAVYNLLKIMKKKRLKNKDVAKAVGVTPEYISMILNRKRKTVSDALKKEFEAAYGIRFGDWGKVKKEVDDA